MFNLNLKPHFLHEILHDARKNKIVNLFSLFCFRGVFFFFSFFLISIKKPNPREICSYHFRQRIIRKGKNKKSGKKKTLSMSLASD